MKRAHRVFAIPLAVLPIVAPLRIAVGQEKATAQEVVATVRKAAGTLSKTGDLTAFKQKHAPWVWKDTYVFVIDCDKNLIAAHPIKPELVGQSSAALKDTKGKNVFPEGWCDAAKKAAGVWVEYWWPKPPDVEDSAGGVIVRVPLRERDPPVYHDRAVPVAAAALKLRDPAPGRRVVHPDAPSGIVHEQEAAGDDGARPGVPRSPHRP